MNKKLIIILISIIAVAICVGIVLITNQNNNSDRLLKVQLDYEVPTLDSGAATENVSFEVISNFTDGLYQMAEDGSPIPALAEKTEKSKDGLTYTFKIREDAYWSNGKPVTADDFVFAWQRACDPEYASEYSFMIYEVAIVKNGYDIHNGKKEPSELGVTAIDNKTLKVELESPVSYFESLLYFPTFFPINREFCESCGDTYGTSAETVLANGAFILDESYSPTATSFTMKKNENYYDKENIKLAGISYQVMKDSQAALLAYQNNDLDVITLSGEQVEQVKDDEDFVTIDALKLWYIAVNSSKYDFMDNYNFRYALACAIDREEVTETILKDGSKPAYFAVPEGLSVGPDGKDYRSTANTFEIGDFEEAKTYYEKACKELGKNKFDIELLVEDDTSAQNIAAYVQQQWNKLEGINVTIKVETKKQRLADMRSQNFCAGITRWGPDYADPMTYLNMWITNNSNNFGLWSNAEYDRIVTSCINGDLAVDAGARWEALKGAEKIVMDNMVILPIYQKCNAMMIRSEVKGVECHAIGVNRSFKNVEFK